jgi:hypothetical protein
MTILRHDVPAKCPPERVWAMLSDLLAVQHYNPGVRSAALVGDKSHGVGAVRSCALAPSGRVVERVTHWEDGHALGLEVVESDWPILTMSWVTRVVPDAGGCRITQELEYEPKFGPVGWLLDRLVMERKLRSTLDGVLASLARHAEGAR